MGLAESEAAVLASSSVELRAHSLSFDQEGFVIVPPGGEVLESISIGFGETISLEDLSTLFERCQVEVFVNGALIADPLLKTFAPTGDWHRFELEYPVQHGDEVKAEFLTRPPFTTEYGLTINAALSIRGSVEVAAVEKSRPDQAEKQNEANPSCR